MVGLFYYIITTLTAYQLFLNPTLSVVPPPFLPAACIHPWGCPWMSSPSPVAPSWPSLVVTIPLPPASLQDHWNKLDLFIIAVSVPDIVSTFTPSMSAATGFVTVLRLLRCVSVFVWVWGRGGVIIPVFVLSTLGTIRVMLSHIPDFLSYIFPSEWFSIAPFKLFCASKSEVQISSF